MSQKNLILHSTRTTSGPSIRILRAGHYIKAQGHSIVRRKNNRIAEAVLIYCYDGQGWLDNGRDSDAIKVTRGSLIYCDKNSNHGYGSSRMNPWSLLWVHFDGPFASYFQSTIGKDNSVIAITLDDALNLKHIFEQIYLHLHTSLDPLSTAIASNHIQFVLYNIIAKMSLTLPTTSQTNSVSLIDHYNNESEPLDKSILYMRQHIDTTISLDDICHEIKLSKYYYSRQFKKATGRGPMTYFMQLKVDKACYLLKNTTQSVKAISESLSFANPYYFSETFKKHTGLAPTHYRDQSSTSY